MNQVNESGEGMVNAIAALQAQSNDGAVIEEDGKRWLYYQGKLQAITWDPQPQCVNVGTLSGLVDFLKDAAPFELDELLAIVENERSVRVYGPESEKTRIMPVIGSAQMSSDLKTFDFGHWMDQETFLINLYTQFDRDMDDFKRLVGYASKVVNDESISQTDDGISQKAVLKSGIHSEESSELAPSIVNLRPYRTFRDIEQPVGMFVFRMKKGPAGVSFALFEADGGAWRLVAMASVVSFLRERLSGVTVA